MKDKEKPYLHSLYDFYLALAIEKLLNSSVERAVEEVVAGRSTARKPRVPGGRKRPNRVE